MMNTESRYICRYGSLRFIRWRIVIHGVVAVALLLSAALAGCDGVEDADTPPEVKLGAFYNLTGSQSGLDIPSSQGAQLAVDEINGGGGVLGRQVKLIVEDGRTDPAVIENRTTEMLDLHPSIAAFIGLSDTDMLLAAAPTAAARKRVFLTSGATSPQLPSQVPTYLFLACFGDNVQAAAAAEWAYRDRSARTVSIVYNSTHVYTRLLRDYFTSRFTELGGQILSSTSYTPDDMSGLADGLQNADVIFLSAGGPDEALEGVRRLRQAGFTGTILGGDGYDSEEVWDQHPEIDEVYFTTHAYLGADNLDPKVTAFRNAYGNAFPGTAPTAFSALGYDAAQLLMKAVSDAGSADPQAVLTALSAIRQFDGVTGAMTFAPGSRIPTKSVTILEAEGGRRRFVRQLMPEKVPAP